MDDVDARIGSVLFSPHRGLFPHVHLSSFNDLDVEALERYGQIKRKSCDKSKFEIISTSCLHANGQLKTLLQYLFGQLPLTKDRSISSVDDFISAVRETVSPETKCVLIVLFHAEALSKISAAALQALFALPKSNETPFFRILTTSMVPFNLIEVTRSIHSVPHVEFQFAMPTEKDQILSKLASSDRLVDVDPKLLPIAVGAAELHTNNFNVLRQIVLHSKRALDNGSTQIPLRVVAESFKEVERSKLLVSGEGNILACLRLPVHLRILLLAAFFASHNNPSSDKRYFSKHHGREKRSERRELNADKQAAAFREGPKAADLQRICFIFQVLAQYLADDIMANEKIDVKADLQNVNVLPMLSTLVNMALLTRGSAACNLDLPKYRCLLSFEMANRIGQSLSRHSPRWIDDYLEKEFV